MKYPRRSRGIVIVFVEESAVLNTHIQRRMISSEGKVMFRKIVRRCGYECEVHAGKVIVSSGIDGCDTAVTNGWMHSRRTG